MATDSITWYSITAFDKQARESPPKLSASGFVKSRVDLHLSVILKESFPGDQLRVPFSPRTWEKKSDTLKHLKKKKKNEQWDFFFPQLLAEGKTQKGRMGILKKRD